MIPNSVIVDHIPFKIKGIPLEIREEIVIERSQHGGIYNNVFLIHLIRACKTDICRFLGFEGTIFEPLGTIHYRSSSRGYSRSAESCDRSLVLPSIQYTDPNISYQDIVEPSGKFIVVLNIDANLLLLTEIKYVDFHGISLLKPVNVPLQQLEQYIISNSDISSIHKILFRYYYPDLRVNDFIMNYFQEVDMYVTISKATCIKCSVYRVDIPGINSALACLLLGSDDRKILEHLDSLKDATLARIHSCLHVFSKIIVLDTSSRVLRELSNNASINTIYLLYDQGWYYRVLAH